MFAGRNPTGQNQLSYLCQCGYLRRLHSGVTFPMAFPDPLWLTALASLITSLASLVRAVRRRR
jgi:hypothetical protein